MLSLMRIVWTILRSGGSLELTLKALGVNTRHGEFDRNKITWVRHLARPMEVRTAKTGRVYVSVGYDAKVSWFMWVKRNQILNSGKVIGMTLSRAKGKKGGWYVSLHKQKVVLSETHKKFVFCNYWRHFWFSDQMLTADLWASMDNKSKSVENLKMVREDIRKAIPMIVVTEMTPSEDDEEEPF